MALGKNKKLGKKKGQKKKADPFLKKEWYTVRAPAVFPKKEIGKTVVTKTQGTKIARDSLLGREFEVSLADLKDNCEASAFLKFRLKVEDVNGSNCLTGFHGMDVTTDKLRSLVRKSQTLIECYVDVRTTDGYALRLFCIGFTKRAQNQTRKTSYALTSQVKAIRKKMQEIVLKEASSGDLNELTNKLMSESIGTEVQKHTQAIYPLKDVLIRKVKMLRTPKLDAAKLLEAHGGVDSLAQGPAQASAPAPDVAGAKVERPDDKKAKKEKAPVEEKKEEKKEEKAADA